MLTSVQKDTTRMVYGDDLRIIGDVVVAVADDKKSCTIIRADGEKLIDKPVLGIGRVLGKGGFHYVVVTDKNVKPDKERNRRWNDLFNMDHVEYSYRVYNSEFEWESVGKVKANNVFTNSMSIEAGAKIHTLTLQDCILR